MKLRERGDSQRGSESWQNVQRGHNVHREKNEHGLSMSGPGREITTATNLTICPPLVGEVEIVGNIQTSMEEQSWNAQILDKQILDARSLDIQTLDKQNLDIQITEMQTLDT